MLMLTCLMGLFVASCDSSEVEQDTDVSRYEAVKAQIVDSDGHCRFPGSGAGRITAVGCPTQEVAEGLVKGLTLGEFQGEPMTVLNLGKYGYVAAKCISDDDRYFNVEVKLNGYETVRLMLVSEAYFSSLNPDNGTGEGESTEAAYTCPKCRSTFAYIPPICPVCGQTTPVPPSLELQPFPAFTMGETQVDFDMEVKLQ